MVKNKIDVLIPDGHKIKNYEKDAAWVLARHYKTTVQVQRPSMDYKVKTADFVVDGVEMELKTILSAKVSKIYDAMNDGQKQASVVVIDIRKSKIIEKRALEAVLDNLRLKSFRSISKVILIASTKKVLEISL